MPHSADTGNGADTGNAPDAACREVTSPAQPRTPTPRTGEPVSPMLPVLPQLWLAGQYLAGDDEYAVPGDWCEALPLGRGRVALSLGDVSSGDVSSGRDTPAEDSRRRLRGVLADSLLSGMSLPGVLARLQRYAATSRRGPRPRACLAVIDPADRAVEYGAFGHGAPLVVDGSGAVRFLPGVPGDSDPSLTWCSSRLDAGDVVVLSSPDVLGSAGGSVGGPRRPGRPGHPMRDALPRVLGGAVDQNRWDDNPGPVADRVCDRVVRWLVRTGYQGNVGLLAAELRARPHRPLVLGLPAEGTALRVIRRALADWLHAVGAGDEDLLAVHLAVVEAATNCVEHAYLGSACPERWMWVNVILDSDGRVRVVVADHGRWRPRRSCPEFRGRGLRLMRNLMDTAMVHRSERGTTVSMSRRLRRCVEYQRPRGLLSPPWQMPT